MSEIAGRPSYATRLNTLLPYWPVAVLAAWLAWAWRGVDFFRSLPAYGDTLELMWALSWYGDALRTGQSLSVYPLAFYPAGWHYAENFYMTLALLPLHWLAGPAFTFNLMALLSFVIGYAGVFLLSRRFLSTALAGVTALLVVFSGVRWFHMLGHLNILLGSALLPWVLWSVDRGLNSPKHAVRWLVAAGGLWAASMSGSMYFAFLGGLAVVAWVGGCLLGRTIGWRGALRAVLVPSGVALLLSAPAIYRLYAASQAQGVAQYSIGEVNFWGASLNSLPLPSLDHPWLGTLARQIYTGTPFEQGLANLGLLGAVLALAGFWAARRNREWRPVQVLAGAAVVLALGLTVKWNNETVMWTWLKPVTAALWGLGHLVKPAFFTGTNPPQPFDGAVPAPGMLLAMFVPFIENARVFARFALVGSIGVSMLAGLALSLVKHRWLQLGLILLLLFEVVPQPLVAQPFTGISHPAFEWLSQQDLAGGSVADIAAGHPYTPVLYVEGESAWATRLHGKPTVGGASSVWPLHTAFLNNWLASHEHAFWDPKLAPILRYYNIRYLLIYLRGDWERGLLAEARQNDQLRFVDCFDPPASGGPWPYPICALQVLPPTGEQKVNLVLEDGWSGQEDWGVWAEGARSTAFWVAMAKGAASLDFKVFPNCLPDQRQKMVVSINGTVVATYDWQACEEHTAHVDLPASLVRQGKNELVLETDYATPPAGNQNETRNLSVGFTQLRVTPH